mmetsp:Transcript_97227/g.275056  ORF Transcript_97227/g.275056 Transcript_97227/m.275056 type:complete len:377 (-) Transcript_97227:1787-2917(-)
MPAVRRRGLQHGPLYAAVQELQRHGLLRGRAREPVRLQHLQRRGPGARGRAGHLPGLRRHGPEPGGLQGRPLQRRRLQRRQPAQGPGRQRGERAVAAGPGPRDRPHAQRRLPPQRPRPAAGHHRFRVPSRQSRDPGLARPIGGRNLHGPRGGEEAAHEVGGARAQRRKAVGRGGRRGGRRGPGRGGGGRHPRGPGGPAPDLRPVRLHCHAGAAAQRRPHLLLLGHGPRHRVVQRHGAPLHEPARRPRRLRGRVRHRGTADLRLAHVAARDKVCDGPGAPRAPGPRLRAQGPEVLLGADALLHLHDSGLAGPPARDLLQARPPEQLLQGGLRHHGRLQSARADRVGRLDRPGLQRLVHRDQDAAGRRVRQGLRVCLQ